MENSSYSDYELTNNIKLSEKAIKYISKLSIDKKDKITWNVDFIFQVEKSLKKSENKYSCTLFDNDSKYNGFIIINPENEDDIPKKGDVIKIDQISKFYDEEEKVYLYECCKYSFIKKNIEFIVNPNELNDISNPKNENLEFQNEIINIEIINLKKNLEISEKKNNDKYTLISNIKETDEDFCILVKCISKDKIKECNYSNSKTKGKIQRYIFEDINYDKINIVAFGNLAIENDKIFQENYLYEIDNCRIKPANPKYNKTNCPYNIILSDKNIIKKINNIYNNNEKKNFTLLSDIISIKEIEIINIFCFVLKDYGIFKYKNKYEGNNEYEGHKILIGDVTFIKIELCLWNDNSNLYKDGDLLYIQNCKVKDYHGEKSIYSTIKTKIISSYDNNTDKEYTDFYSKNSDLNKFKLLKFGNSIKLNGIKQNNNIKKKKQNNKDILKKQFGKIIFIKDIENIYLNNDENTYILSAIVQKITYSLSNFYEGCSKCIKKIKGDECEHCKCKDKQLYTHFSILVRDSTGSIWIEMYGTVAEIFLNIKAEKYKKILCGIYQSNSENEKKEAIDKINELKSKIEYNRYFFGGKVKKSNYNNEKYKFTVHYVRKQLKEENHQLLDYLKSILKK